MLSSVSQQKDVRSGKNGGDGVRDKNMWKQAEQKSHIRSAKVTDKSGFFLNSKIHHVTAPGSSVQRPRI